MKIPKEVRKHKETIFFGLSLRQFLCAALSLVIAAGVFLLTRQFVGKETASWLCILVAAPVALAGFFSYNGLALEEFIWAVIRSELLCAGPRKFIARNLYYDLLHRKERDDFD